MIEHLNRRQFLKLTSAMGVLPFIPSCVLQKTYWAKAEKIQHQLGAPTIPRREFNLDEYGAKGDGLFKNTQVFEAAIKACAAAGGGRVIVPKGRYLTGAIELTSNVELHLQAEAELLFSTEPNDYPKVLSRYEGVELYNYSPLIYAYKAQNIALTGRGLINGQAADENWWSWCGSPKFGWQPGMPRQTEDRNALFDMAEAGVAVEKRQFGHGHFLRPSMVEFYQCENVLIEDVTLKDSPFWNIHPVLSRNVTVRGVTVTGHGPNNDGCNPESVNGMLIENCLFDTGDDCIAIKSGRNADGRRLMIASENIVIRHCRMRAGHGGVVIGSEISGGVRNVFVEHCQMDSPELWYALRFKNNAMRGGVIEDIYVRDVTVGQVKFAAITCDFNYEEGANGEFTPQLNNLQVDNLKVKHAIRVLDSQGLDNAPIRGIRLTDCQFNGVTQASIVKNTQQLILDNVAVNGKPVSSL
ncbi:glycoside hydrolase family 28 protein [Neptunicella marina]|uniref:Glycoside hydrolase family 28 protein n=1 Tax=Neptunicella marina TaxID=2125989 RepID=A0A8J6ITH0_9ALTE|nr:glycoside hydrolase family 28 protein [Neptunicella marina]MBC3765492.1 glycoside hydrolase family 28 protein [Neptunicella marina]